MFLNQKGISMSIVGSRLSAVLVLAFIALAATGCKPRDGDVLRKIVRRTGEKLQGTAGPVGQLGAGVSASARSGAAGRVEARLRWDRYLANVRVEASGDEDGVVVLTGKVKDVLLKQRALDLAQSTVGVERVKDEVKVSAE
jgi:osmotically-inducible protein OsmY